MGRERKRASEWQNMKKKRKVINFWEAFLMGGRLLRTRRKISSNTACVAVAESIRGLCHFWWWPTFWYTFFLRFYLTLRWTQGGNFLIWVWKIFDFYWNYVEYGTNKFLELNGIFLNLTTNWNTAESETRRIFIKFNKINWNSQISFHI